MIWNESKLKEGGERRRQNGHEENPAPYVGEEKDGTCALQRYPLPFHHRHPFPCIIDLSHLFGGIPWGAANFGTRQAQCPDLPAQCQNLPAQCRHSSQKVSESSEVEKHMDFPNFPRLCENCAGTVPALCRHCPGTFGHCSGKIVPRAGPAVPEPKEGRLCDLKSMIQRVPV